MEVGVYGGEVGRPWSEHVILVGVLVRKGSLDALYGWGGSATGTPLSILLSRMLRRIDGAHRTCCFSPRRNRSRTTGASS